MSCIRLKWRSFVCSCRTARPSGCLLASRVALESNTAVSAVKSVNPPISLMTRPLTRPLTRRLSKPRASSAKCLVCRTKGGTTTRSVQQSVLVASTTVKESKVDYIGSISKVGKVGKVGEMEKIAKLTNIDMVDSVGLVGKVAR